MRVPIVRKAWAPKCGAPAAAKTNTCPTTIARTSNEPPNVDRSASRGSRRWASPGVGGEAVWVAVNYGPYHLVVWALTLLCLILSKLPKVRH